MPRLIRSRGRGARATATNPAPNISRTGVRDSATVGRTASRDANAGDQCGRQEQQPGGSGEHCGRAREGHEETGQQRPDQGAQTLHRGGRAVRRDELLGRAGERRQQCLERRPEERRREAHDGCEDIHERCVAGRCARRGGPECDGADQARCQDEPLAREAVAERGREGRDDGGREQAHQTGNADGRGASVVVGVDAESDEVRPLRSDRAGPRQLDSADLLVAGCRAERCQQCTDPAHRRIESLPGERDNLRREARTREVPAPLRRLEQ